MSKVEKVVGKTMDCVTCGLRLICRSKTYEAYEEHPKRTVLQWQNDNGGAHYKWIGPEKYKCVDTNGKDILPKKKENSEPKTGNGLVKKDLMKDDDLKEAAADAKRAGDRAVLEPLDQGTAKVIHNDAILLYKTRQVIIDTVAAFEKDAHPGMIWEMTALIYNKHFGEKKHES